jgi:hypothetical protein
VAAGWTDLDPFLSISNLSCLPHYRPRPAPQLLVNGPGTCIPVCGAAFLYRCAAVWGGGASTPPPPPSSPLSVRACGAGCTLRSLFGPRLRPAHATLRRPAPRPAARVLFLLDCRIAYVESIARVEHLSLSGRILHASRVADALFVQWPEMARRFPGTTYAGRLY